MYPTGREGKRAFSTIFGCENPPDWTLTNIRDMKTVGRSPFPLNFVAERMQQTPFLAAGNSRLDVRQR